MGGYDLYGNYYPRTQDALNAESAQCAEIDARRADKKAEEARSRAMDLAMENEELRSRVQELEKKIELLIGKKEGNPNA